MSAEKRKVWVVGHKNPDTDSICAALSYAYLKNQTENDKTYVAKRAGAVNAETHYVLDYFGAQTEFRGSDSDLPKSETSYGNSWKSQFYCHACAGSVSSDR